MRLDEQNKDIIIGEGGAEWKKLFQERVKNKM